MRGPAPAARSCPDFAAEHADISTGGIGEDNDWTLTIVRTELGEEVITRMITDGTIIARPAQEDEKAMKLLRTLSIVSRRRWPDDADPAPTIGVPPPKKKTAAATPSPAGDPMELLFIRHALPLRVEGFEGPADPGAVRSRPRTRRGYLAEYLSFERIHAVFASPLRRAVQTAEPVAANSRSR